MKTDTRICIVGLGNFGTLAAAILKQHFFVSAIDTDVKKAEETAQKLGIKLVFEKEIGSFDVVILCVPISKTENVIRKIAPKMKKGALLVDTCSVKTWPCRWMRQNTGKDIEILGVHPMFGPMSSKFNLKHNSWNIENLQIILCPVRISADRLGKIRNFLEKLKLKVIETTPENHDKQNAKTLALVHFLGRALMASGIKDQEIFTPGYASLLKVIPHTAGDKWRLFYDMNNFNPYSEKIRGKFMENCRKLEEKIVKAQKNPRA